MSKDKGRIEVRKAQRILALIWLLGSVIPFSSLLKESWNPESAHFDMEQAWAWFWPYVTPTLTAILSTLALDEIRRRPTSVSRFSLWSAVALSVVYLAALATIPVFHDQFDLPEDPEKARAVLTTMLLQSKLYLPPLYALVGISLGVFFSSREGAAGP